MNRLRPFEWITALRFLKEGQMQTIFIITAVAIGVAVIVFMSAMLSSLQANFLKRVLTSQPHIQLIPPDEVARPLRRPASGQIVVSIVQRPVQRIRSIDQWQKIRDELRTWPEITNVSPTMAGSALAVRGDASRSINLTGMDPDVYFKIVRVPDYIVAGGTRLLSDDIPIPGAPERDSHASTALGDVIDRSLHAATARFTAGLSPAALAEAYTDRHPKPITTRRKIATPDTVVDRLGGTRRGAKCKIAT